jgi:hypothetical protein
MNELLKEASSEQLVTSLVYKITSKIIHSSFPLKIFVSEFSRIKKSLQVSRMIVCHQDLIAVRGGPRLANSKIVIYISKMDKGRRIKLYLALGS